MAVCVSILQTSDTIIGQYFCALPLCIAFMHFSYTLLFCIRCALVLYVAFMYCSCGLSCNFFVYEQLPYILSSYIAPFDGSAICELTCVLGYLEIGASLCSFGI